MNRIDGSKPKLLSMEELVKRLEDYGVDTNEINRNTYFGFEFEKDLSPNTSFTCQLNNVPSAEGPLIASGQSFTFNTYGKFG